VLARALLFLGVFVLLQASWQLLLSEHARLSVVHAAVVAPAAVIAQRLTPQLTVLARGINLRALGEPAGARFGINIVNGCDGTEMLFVLSAAFAVAPLRRRARLVGLLIGGALVYVLNQLRILALFYTQGRMPALFDALHGYLAPVTMVVLILIYFYVWIDRASASMSTA
jgi:exosortase/archaeosortase family protein